MSELKQAAVQMIDKLPEEKVQYVIQYIQQLELPVSKKKVTPKMQAFLDLESMITASDEEIDYQRELAQAREEKYGNIG